MIDTIGVIFAWIGRGVSLVVVVYAIALVASVGWKHGQE